MAKPSGAVVAGDYYFKVAEGAASAPSARQFFYMYFVFPLPWMPSQWHSTHSSKDTYNIEFKPHLEVTGTGETLQIEYYLGRGNALSSSVDYSGTATGTPEWIWAAATDTKYPTPHSFSAFPSGVPSEKPQYAIAFVAFRADTDTETGDVLAVHAFEINLTHDDEDNVRSDAPIDSTTEANRLSVPDMPASSHIMMCATIDTLNNFLSDQKTRMTCPVVGNTEG